MQTTVKTSALVAVTVLGIAGAVRAVPVVSDVVMTQIADTRRVEITYNLGGEDAIVTLSIETNGVAIPDSAVTWLSGDVCKVVAVGTGKSIMWNAGFDWPENVTQTAGARVTAWCTNAPPLYCAVNLVDGASAETYPVTYYASAAAVPKGVTNELYKTYRILMRRIDSTNSEGFIMGSPKNEFERIDGVEGPVEVVLTEGYYTGVYQVTQSQWFQVMGNWPSSWFQNDLRLTRPVEQVSYYQIRENPNNTPNAAVDWPNNDVVTASSFMGRLRQKTGLAGFDLPTEAQWEYACRAGTTGALNDGTKNISAWDIDAHLDLLGCYINNAVGSAAVGSYNPNTWGLYDMHGNVWEWCLDWYANVLEGGTDPRGADSGPSRSNRGGSYTGNANGCRTAKRNSNGPGDTYSTLGFRLVRNLP